MKLGLLQLNPTIGDIPGNADKIVTAVKNSNNKGVDLFITSELVFVGYPPKDLLLHGSFIDIVEEQLNILAGKLKPFPPVLIGTVVKNRSEVGKPIYNAAAYLTKGKVEKIFNKFLLPTYDVFDEVRYFEPAKESGFFTLNAKKYKTPFLYINQVGGNDDLVFDGRSFAVNENGKILAKAESFKEDTLVVDLTSDNNRIEKDDFSVESESWKALVLGTKDYLTKCGFKKALIGLSGGI